MTNTIWDHSYKVPEVVKVIETENSTMVARDGVVGGGEEAKGSCCFLGLVSVLQDEYFWRSVSQKCKYIYHWNVHLKMAKMVN